MDVRSRIAHTTSAFLILNMGVDSISGNSKLARGQGDVPVTVAQSLLDFDTSYFLDHLPDAARTRRDAKRTLTQNARDTFLSYDPIVVVDRKRTQISV